MKKLKPLARSFLWRIVILTGAVLLSLYLLYRLTFINFSPAIVILSLILFFAELHTIFHLYGMFYSLWPRKYKRYTEIYKNKLLRLNLFICVCGEPQDVIRETILAAKKTVDHYNKKVNPNFSPQVVVLNDGKAAGCDNWQEVENLAKSLDVVHIARDKTGGFKAGNINNGLIQTPSPDPDNTLDIIFDSDFTAHEDFLIEITKPFADESVDFAQSPQRYKNEQTWVAKAAAAHQIFFFDYICSAKGHDNALFLCGTNFAIRRSALIDVGGMDTRFITEDYATSLELHLKGKKGVFIPKVLAEGMAPTTLKAYFSQQQRWSKGSFDVTFTYLKKIIFGPLTLRQKFHYLLSASYYLIGIRDLILMLAPLPYLFLGVSLIKANTLQYLIFIYSPLLLYNFILYFFLFRHPIKSLVLDIASFPVYSASFLSSLFKKDLSFIVTIKKYEKENPFAVYKFQLLVAVLLAIGLYFGFGHPVGKGGAFLNYFWAGFDMTILFFGFYLIVRENFNTSILENIYFNIYLFLENIFKLPLRVIPRTVYTFIIIAVFGYLLVQTPTFKTFASLETVKQAVIAVPRKELLVPEKGAYYGYYLPTLNTHPDKPVTNVVFGEKTSLVMFYQDWSDGTSFDAGFAAKLSAGGRVPVITWEPWNSNKNLSVGHLQGEFSHKEIIDGKHDDFIRQWAQGAANYKQPIFLRFAHEMNGNWYSWGNQNGTTDSYIKMWRHVHNIFEQEGADNVLWLWSPNNTDQHGSSASILMYYPGDEYVDWIGFSGFNWGTSSKTSRWVSFKDLAYEAYGQLSQINKPIMVTETSSVSTGGNKEAWFRQTLTSDLPQFPKIKAVVLFNDNSNNADFSLKSGQNYQEIVQGAIISNDYYLKDPIFKVD